MEIIHSFLGNPTDNSVKWVLYVLLFFSFEVQIYINLIIMPSADHDRLLKEA